ncbi:MAG: glycosyltransferase family 2 protein [Rhodanobacter sp.]|nr:MAG: glycosyltransferase family 2 protein [Rhodanobacter sp.]
MSLSVDVIVRTQADAPRSKLLFRALDSIQDQNGVTARAIVVVNGQRFDGATLKTLENRQGIFLHHEPQASARLARAVGRWLVTAPFFSYLDDDDVLIAGSLLEPLKWLEGHRDYDVLINNGYFIKNDGVLSESTHIASHIKQPVLSLLDECWLSPGACIFRTASVPATMLNSDWSHQEWTHLAFELCAQNKRLHFMDVATVHYYDTPGSMSKQIQQHEAALDLLRLVRHDVRVDANVRRKADRKYLRTLHNLAATYREDGRYMRAWRCHLGSLRPPYTAKYLLFTRKLLWPFGGRMGGNA